MNEIKCSDCGYGYSDIVVEDNLLVECIKCKKSFHQYCSGPLIIVNAWKCKICSPKSAKVDLENTTDMIKRSADLLVKKVSYIEKLYDKNVELEAKNELIKIELDKYKKRYSRSNSERILLQTKLDECELHKKKTQIIKRRKFSFKS